MGHSSHITKIIRVGSSLGVIIPKLVLDQLFIERGDVVVFGFYGDKQILIRALTEQEVRQLKPTEVKI